LIERRIAWLKEQLADVHRHRELYRQRRRQAGIPVIALVGYTNAGKSTLLNAMTGADVLAEDKLFATLDPTTRQVLLPGNIIALMTDTVGFIQKLPSQLIAAFRATLEEIEEADVLLHVVDVTHRNAQEHAQTVEQTLRELGVADKPILTVLNKIDLLEGATAEDVGQIAAEMGLPKDIIAVSAARGWGLQTLGERIVETLARHMVRVDAYIPYQRNDLVALWRQRGVIEVEEFGSEGAHIVGRLPPALAPQFACFARM
jgi:GTP-binding protein HflX